MRLFLSILAISVVLPSIGCSSNLKCRRETALLRAEYLDLEDKYYALLSNSDATAASAVPSANHTTPQRTLVGQTAPIPQPVIYGSGVQQPIVTNTMPEVIYYDQSGGYPVQQSPSRAYPAQGYPAHTYPTQGAHGYPADSYPVQGETYYSDFPLGTTPTLAPPQGISDVGTSLGGSQSSTPLQGTYYPSPVEGTEAREPSSNRSTGELPTPSSILDEGLDSDLDHEQSRFNIEIEDTHEIGHQIKIETASAITEVLINKSVSQGKNTDGQPGDDGVEILIQPKTADGAVVDEAGNLTISLIDPAADQGERQIGQWSFLKEEAMLFFAEDEFDNRGILLQLKWDRKIPANKRLTVYVRFETSDNRIMETTSDIFIDPPNELSIVRKSDNFNSEFTQLEKDDVQGWYKSQTVRRRNQNGRTSGNDNWGRSAVSTGNRSRGPKAASATSQPQWRPSR